MKKTLILIFLLTLPISTALNTNKILDDLEKIKNNYNENFEAPGFFNALFGNEKINLHITLNNKDNLTIGIITKNGKVTLIQEGPIENPTLNAYTTEPVMDKFLYSDNPFIELKTALDNDQLTYKPATFTSKIKYGLVGFITGLFK